MQSMIAGLSSQPGRTARTKARGAGTLTLSPLTINNPTSAASAITGALIIATTLGTVATSVGIGGGNIFAGTNITAANFVTGSNGVVSGAHMQVGNTSNYSWNGRSTMYSGANGRIHFLSNDGSTALTRLTFGVETSASPAFTFSGTTMTVGLGDGTGNGTLALGYSSTGTSSAGAITLNAQTGVITTESLTTAAATAYTLTLTNSVVAATSRVFASVYQGTNTTANLFVETITPAAGSVVIVIRNNNTLTAFNGTLKIAFLVF